jgi:hypothetical protein
MSPKKTILRTLSKRYEEEGPGSLVRPPSIPGFGKSPEKYQRAVNDLLKDRMVEGMKDEEGHMAIALNGHRMEDIRRELRPLWAHPGILAAAALTLLVAGLGLLA